MASLPSKLSHSWRTDNHKNEKKTGGELWVAGGRKGMQAANVVSVYWIAYKFLSSGIAVH